MSGKRLLTEAHIFPGAPTHPRNKKSPPASAPREAAPTSPQHPATPPRTKPPSRPKNHPGDVFHALCLEGRLVRPRRGLD
ncbi:hypothetical protein GCM10009525_16890 [Streptosporangium amethystogenes subsp. fukuiense]